MWKEHTLLFRALRPSPSLYVRRGVGQTGVTRFADAINAVRRLRGMIDNAMTELHSDWTIVALSSRPWVAYSEDPVVKNQTNEVELTV